jgi:hypothetical protein
LVAMGRDQPEGAGAGIRPSFWVGNQLNHWKRLMPLNAMLDKHEKVKAFATSILDERNFHRIYEKQQTMDKRVKQFAGMLLDENKRTAHMSHMHEVSMKNHQKMDRTIQFWTRTIAIYASYKVYILFSLAKSIMWFLFNQL